MRNQSACYVLFIINRIVMHELVQHVLQSITRATPGFFNGNSEAEVRVHRNPGGRPSLACATAWVLDARKEGRELILTRCEASCGEGVQHETSPPHWSGRCRGHPASSCLRSTVLFPIATTTTAPPSQRTILLATTSDGHQCPQPPPPPPRPPIRSAFGTAAIFSTVLRAESADPGNTSEVSSARAFSSRPT